MTIRRYSVGGPGGLIPSGRPISLLRAFGASMLLLPISLLLQSCGSTVEFKATSGVLTEVARFSAPYDVGALAFSPDDNQLAVNTLFVGTDVELWDWRKRRVSMRLRYGGGPRDGKGLAYSKDGRFIAVRHQPTGSNNVVRIWDAGNGDLVTDIPENSRVPSGPIAFVGKQNLLIRVVLRSLEDKGDQLIADESQSGARVWGIHMDHFLPRFLTQAWSDDQIAIEGLTVHLEANQIDEQAESDIYTIDVGAGRVERILRHPFPADYGVESFALSPDGRQFAVGFQTGALSASPNAVAIFDGLTGKQIFAIPAETEQLTRGLAYTPDGRFLVVADVDQEVRVVDLQRLRVVQTIPMRAEVAAVSPKEALIYRP